MLSACGGRHPAPPSALPTAAATAAPIAVSAVAPATVLRPYPTTDKFLQCVPFARTVSGIDLHGDAWTWWRQAAGHYARGNQPEIGAVLSMPRSSRLGLGHVAVVAAVKGPREVLLTHANWGSIPATRGVIHERMPAFDVSPNNDWTQIRLWNIKGIPGGVYPADGFIYNRPDAPASASLR